MDVCYEQDKRLNIQSLVTLIVPFLCYQELAFVAPQYNFFMIFFSVPVNIYIHTLYSSQIRVLCDFVLQQIP